MSVVLLTIILCFAMPLTVLILHYKYINNNVINIKKAAAYAGSFFLAAPIAELFFNSLYEYFFGKPVWVYHILPIAGGDTSLLACIIWTMYGLNTFFVYEKLNVANKSFLRTKLFKSLFMGVEGPVMEVVFNLLTLALFGSFVAYYNPGEAFHLTSLQVVPIYAWCGLWAAIWSEKLFVNDVSWKLVSIYFFLGVISLILMSKLL